MEKISVGQLRVLTEEAIYTFGHPSTGVCPPPSSDQATPAPQELRAEIRVVDDAFWIRMFILSDLGFAESYMVGDIEVSNLDALFKVSGFF